MEQRVKAPKVMIATPSLDGSLCIEYVSSLLSSNRLISQHGVEVDYMCLKGDAFIDKARNHMAASFLKSDADSIFFIDADQGWNPEAFVRVVLDPHEIVAGAVPKKTDNLEFNGINLDADEAGNVYMDGGLLRCKHIGTGFMRLRRSALEKYIAAYPETYKPGDGAQHEQIHNVFDCGPDLHKRITDMIGPVLRDIASGKGSGKKLAKKALEDIKEFYAKNQFWGEDLFFCDRWAALGERIWIDPDIDFQHSGKKAYRGNLFKWLQASGAVRTGNASADSPKLHIVEDFAQEAV